MNIGNSKMGTKGQQNGLHQSPLHSSEQLEASVASF
jgi:hypothetical protein